MRNGRNGALNPGLAAHTNGNPQFAPYLLPASEKMKDYEPFAPAVAMLAHASCIG